MFASSLVTELGSLAQRRGLDLSRANPEVAEQGPGREGYGDHRKPDQHALREPREYFRDTDQRRDAGEKPVQGAIEHAPDYAQLAGAIP